MKLEQLCIDKELEYWKIPGMSIGLYADGKTLLCRGEGIADLKSGAKADEHTLFCIASCTKAFTATIALMLQKEKLLDFMEPVTKYLPGLKLKDPVAAKAISLRDMLTHVSGLPGHDFMWPYYDISEEEFISRVGELEYSEAFRTKAQYNNVMYILAGIVEEKVSGKRWGELVREKIFEPLGMKESFVSIEEAQKRDPQHLAKGYLYHDGEITQLDPIAPGERASGSLVISAADMMKWLRFQLDGLDKDGNRLLTMEELAFLHTPQIIFGEKDHLFEQDSLPILYGYGWFIREYRNLKVIYHHGGTLGFCSLQMIIPEKNMALTVLINAHGIAEMFTDAILFPLVDQLFFGEDTWQEWREKYHREWKSIDHFVDRTGMYGAREKEVSCDESVLCGTYKSSAYGNAVIEKKESGLFLRFKSFDVRLEKWNRNEKQVVFCARGLIADTEIYTLPVVVNAQGKWLEIPLEEKTPAIRFERMVTRI